MTCDNIYELLSAKLDDALTEQEDQQLQAHLEECESCRRLYAAMFDIEEQTRALEVPAPEGLKRGVMYRIRQEAGGAKAKKRRFWGVGTGLGLVAAALVMMVGAGIIKLPKPVKNQPKTVHQAEISETISADNFQTNHDKHQFLPGSDSLETEAAPETDYYGHGSPAPVASEPETPPEPTRQNEAPAPETPDFPTVSEPSAPVNADDPAVIPDPVTPTPSEPEPTPTTEPVRRPTGPVDPQESGPEDPDDPAEPLLEEPQPLTEELIAACTALTEDDVPVLVYTEFSFESMLYLLEQEEPELYEALADLEPMTLEELQNPSEDEDPEAEPESPTEADTVAPPVIPDFALPDFLIERDPEAEEEPLPPEQRMVICCTQYQNLLALHEWMLKRLPRELKTDLELVSAEAATYLRMEELDPESGSLRSIVTWDRPTGPVAWPEFWARDWVTRFRTSENWALFFPDWEYSPLPDDLAYLVFLTPTVEEPIPEREPELDTEPETEPENK